MRLYAFGSNGSGQLGIGSKDDVSTPQVCLFPEGSELPGRPLKVAAGGNHTLVLLDDGNVYYAGSPRDGRAQLGTSLASTTSFQRAYISDLGHKVTTCSAFWEGSVFVSNENVCYTTGSGSKGELGTGASLNSLDLQMLQNFPPDRLHDQSTVMNVASAVDHTVVVLANGDVWGWGNGRKGQLGDPKGFVPAPRRLQCLDFPVFRAVCGREFTFLIGQGGLCAVMGSDKYEVKARAPATVTDWKDIGASWGSIFVLKKDGEIESWGRNDHSQLAPPGLADIEQIAVGSEHVVALTKEGKVVAWGWGEHGNCGAGTNENGDVKGRSNQVNIGQYGKVLGLGSGCATSFFWTEDVPP